MPFSLFEIWGRGVTTQTKPTAMPLSDFPREILLEVTDYLGDSGMNALARTNSQVYDLLNPRLYRRDVTKPESKSLIWGAKYRLEGTIQQAIDAGQNFTPIPKSFQTALQVVIGSDQEYARLVELLLQVDGINIGKQLGIATSRGYVDIVKLLLDYPGTDPNFAERDGRTALMQSYEPQVVKILLEHEGIEVNRQDHSGCTALSQAIHYSSEHYMYSGKYYSNKFRSQYRDLEIAKLLLERKDIDVNTRENNGWTALHWACYNGCQTIVDILLEKDTIDPNIREIEWGFTPLALACHFCCDIAIVRSLLSHPRTDLNVVDSSGLSILADVLESKTSRLVYLLHCHQRINEIESLLRAAGAT